MVTVSELAEKPVSRLTPADLRVLRAINARRSRRALRMDLSRNARVPRHVRPWLRHPGKYDIPGVDTAVTTEHEHQKTSARELLNNPEVEKIRKLIERLFHKKTHLRHYNGYPVIITEDRNAAISLVPATHLLKYGFKAKPVRGAPITRFTTTYVRIKGKTLKYPKEAGELILQLKPTTTRAYHSEKIEGPLELIIGKKRKIYVLIAPKP